MMMVAIIVAAMIYVNLCKSCLLVHNSFGFSYRLQNMSVRDTSIYFRRLTMSMVVIMVAIMWLLRSGSHFLNLG